MKFTDSHEWIELEGDIGFIGITQYAQKELGDIVYVELPKINSILAAGEQIAVLESTKAAADVYAPVSCEILEVNQSLKTQPQKINMSAQTTDETGGWLCKIKVTNPDELDTLLSESAYQQLINS